MLIVASDLRKDEEYREVILTACIDFITPEDLFSMLQWRFDEAEQETHKHPADRVATQYKYVHRSYSYSVSCPEHRGLTLR
jgi:hypothetical protein